MRKCGSGRKRGDGRRRNRDISDLRPLFTDESDCASWILSHRVGDLAVGLALCRCSNGPGGGEGGTTTPAPDKTEQIIEGLDITQPPLWSFAWLSDMHIGTARPEFIAKALHHVDTLKPHFLLITGDNNFLEAAPANPEQPETLGLRRQRFLKAVLAGALEDYPTY